MSADIDNVVPMTVTASLTPEVVPSYDTLLILSATTPNGTWATTELTRTYTTLAGVLVDFPVASPEYLQASAFFGQSPKPARCIIGRLSAASIAMILYVTPTTVVNSTVYKVTMGGASAAGAAFTAAEASYTSDGSATLAEICTGIAAAINGLSFSGVSATGVSGTTVSVTGPSNGWIWIKLRNLADTVDYGPAQGGLNLLSIYSAGADASPAMATQLTAIAAENNDFAAIQNAYEGLTVDQSIAGYADANNKIYQQAVFDTAIATHVLSGATDVAAVIKAAARQNTSIEYYDSPNLFLDAAHYGRVLPIKPGFDDWAGKQPSGPRPTNLTDTQITNIQAKNANYYAGRTRTGRTAAGSYIELRRGIFYLVAQIQIAVKNLLDSRDKTALNTIGIALIVGAIRTACKQNSINAEGNGILLSFVINFPNQADISLSDLGTGTLSGITVSAVLSVATKKVPITIAFSLT